MTDWVIHFVHQRDPNNEAILYNNEGDGVAIPFHADHEKASRSPLDLWTIKDEDVPLDFDADALSVMLRILDDGHIRSGWSVRNRRATIYGPRPACCFTEMPLYALLDYARTRGDTKAVDLYGIAVLKRELFAAGGRPVIYGLSGKHRELADNAWPRLLDASCGISDEEQYRYVAMNLRKDPPIDWSHEREWRWADVQDELDCPGLPVWLESDLVPFSRVIVIVRSADEAERILDQLKLMRDSGSDNYENTYNRKTLLATRVLVIEEVLSLHGKQPSHALRLDDVSMHELKVVSPITPGGGTLDKAKNAIAKAKQAAGQAAKEWRDTQGRMDVFGFAYLMVDGPRTEVVEALAQLGEIAPSGGVGYRVCSIGGSGETGLLGEAEASVHAAIHILEHELPGTAFYIRTIWD